jgi:CBS domain containing-hemolysin-like protein
VTASTPRTEITAIELEEGIEGLSQVFIESGHSKVLVYKDSLEEVIGYCHSLALIQKTKGYPKHFDRPHSESIPEAMPATRSE